MGQTGNGATKKEVKNEGLKKHEMLNEDEMVIKANFVLGIATLAMLGLILWNMHQTDTAIQERAGKLESNLSGFSSETKQSIGSLAGTINDMKQDLNGDSFSKNAEEIKKSLYFICSDAPAPTYGAMAENYIDEAKDCQVAGTGFAINDDGILITAKHVIERAKKIVIFKDSEYLETITDLNKVDVDDLQDIAFIKISSKTNPVKLYQKTDLAPIGSKIAFIGYPLSRSPIMHEGIISAVSLANGKELDYTINAFVDSGQSGAPLFIENTGEVIGIINSRTLPNVPIMQINDVNTANAIERILYYQAIILTELTKETQKGIGNSAGINKDIFQRISFGK